MAQNQELRSRTSAPTAPSAGVFQFYSNASGALIMQNTAGRLIQVGGQLTGTLTDAQVATGGSATLTTGTLFTSFAGVTTGLGAPAAWGLWSGPANQNFAVPLYNLR